MVMARWSSRFFDKRLEDKLKQPTQTVHRLRNRATRIRKTRKGSSSGVAS